MRPTRICIVFCFNCLWRVQHLQGKLLTFLGQVCIFLCIVAIISRCYSFYTQKCEVIRMLVTLGFKLGCICYRLQCVQKWSSAFFDLWLNFGGLPVFWTGIRQFGVCDSSSGGSSQGEWHVQNFLTGRLKMNHTFKILLQIISRWITYSKFS